MKGKKLLMRICTFLIATVLLLLFSASVFAQQVGVNTNNPTQTLDVNGKVKVGNDNTAPTNGTIRYDGIDQDFEGYADGEWKSLTKSAVADDPVPVVFAHFGVAPTGVSTGSNFEPFSASYNYTSSTPTNSTFSVTVPNDKIFVVDQICVTQDGGSTGGYFRASVRPTSLENGTQTIRNPQIMITGSLESGTTCVEAERAPILVVSSGGSIQAWNSVNSAGRVRVMAYGFFVDDLDQYFGY